MPRGRLGFDSGGSGWVPVRGACDLPVDLLIKNRHATVVLLNHLQARAGLLGDEVRLDVERQHVGDVRVTGVIEGTTPNSWRFHA